MSSDSSTPHRKVPSLQQQYEYFEDELKDEAQDAVQNDNNGGITFRDYMRVMAKYNGYRNYFMSHILQHLGDWFVRIASLLLVTELAPDSGSSLARLTLSVLLPKPIFAHVGGILSDNLCRRHLMIALDLISGVVVLGFLLAIEYQSLPILYCVSTLRSAVISTYYPVTTGIVPLLVPDTRDLQLAVTMNSWAWCTMAIVGGTLAGTATAYIGLYACYSKFNLSTRVQSTPEYVSFAV